jgi:hypothetical protein
LKDKVGHKDGRTNEDKNEEHELLPCVEFAKVDSVQTGFGHSTDAEEQGIGETDMGSGRGSPEDDSSQ